MKKLFSIIAFLLMGCSVTLPAPVNSANLLVKTNGQILGPVGFFSANGREVVNMWTTNTVNTNVLISFNADTTGGNGFMNSRWVFKGDGAVGSFTNGTTTVITNGTGANAGYFVFCNFAFPSVGYAASKCLQTNKWVSIPGGAAHNGDLMVTLFEGTIWATNIWPAPGTGVAVNAQPPSANLTNWSSFGTNKILLTTNVVINWTASSGTVTLTTNATGVSVSFTPPAPTSNNFSGQLNGGQINGAIAASSIPSVVVTNGSDARLNSINSTNTTRLFGQTLFGSGLAAIGILGDAHFDNGVDVGGNLHLDSTTGNIDSDGNLSVPTIDVGNNNFSINAFGQTRFGASDGGTVIGSATAAINFYENDSEIELSGNRVMLPQQVIGDNFPHLAAIDNGSGEGDLTAQPGYYISGGLLHGDLSGATNILIANVVGGMSGVNATNSFQRTNAALSKLASNDGSGLTNIVTQYVVGQTPTNGWGFNYFSQSFPGHVAWNNFNDLQNFNARGLGGGYVMGASSNSGVAAVTWPSTLGEGKSTIVNKWYLATTNNDIKAIQCVFVHDWQGVASGIMVNEGVNSAWMTCPAGTQTNIFAILTTNTFTLTNNCLGLRGYLNITNTGNSLLYRLETWTY